MFKKINFVKGISFQNTNSKTVRKMIRHIVMFRFRVTDKTESLENLRGDKIIHSSGPGLEVFFHFLFGFGYFGLVAHDQNSR